MRRLYNMFLMVGVFCLPGGLLWGMAPVTTIQSITNAVASTTVPVTIRVNDFTDIGQFTLTIRFDTTRIRYLTFTGHPSLSGMTISYTASTYNKLGTLVLGWTGPTSVNQSLPDSSILATLNFLYLTGTGTLNFYHQGLCRYRRYTGSTLVTLDDTEKYEHYINGGISNRTAPRIFAPEMVNPASGALALPITVEQFTNISALTLYLEYDPAVLTYQNTFAKNSVFGNSFVVGSVLQSSGMRQMVIQWYSMTAVSLADGAVLCALNFTYNTSSGGVTKLEWFDNGATCELVDDLFDVLLDYPTASHYINGQIGANRTDIVLQKKPVCGGFSVKLKPLMPVQKTLTHLTFTVKWPAAAGTDVYLTDLQATWPGLQQVGNRLSDNGSYYVTFSTNSHWAVNWSAGVEYEVMTFRHTGTGTGTADFTIIATDFSSVAPGINTGYRIEVDFVNTAHATQNNANGVMMNCGVCMKVFLQGSYNPTTHLMRNDLAAGSLIPLNQPYGTTPWSYSGQEQISAYPGGLVDWVLVELRTDSAAGTGVDLRAALLLQDGSVVDTNGLSPLVFTRFLPGEDYYIVVYHRSHLPIMSAAMVALPNTQASAHHFTINPSSNVYPAANPGAIELEPGVYGMIAGDLNHDNLLKYSGPANDRSLIFSRISTELHPAPSFLTSLVSGYFAEDLNMNGVVKYSGSQNDQSIIFSNIDALTSPTNLNTVYRGKVPIAYPLQ